MVAAMEETSPLVEMRGISKTFGSIKALVDVSLVVHAGEVHALMGENGAGKSTLIKILSGAYVADSGGEIHVAGTRADIRGPADSRRLGIAVIYQELALAPNLTVAENMFLGRERIDGGPFSRRRMNGAARPILADLGVSFAAETKVAALSMGERQVVEIARAVSDEARVIVMDEPTTSLTTAETERLFAIIARLKARNIAIVYISHRMDEIYALADRVSVLRDSRHVGTLARGELSADRLVRMMVGRELSTFYTKTSDHRDSTVLLEVEGLGDGRRVRDCSFRLHRGEVLGIAGLVGSGRTELARLVFGADRTSAGRIRLEGRECHFASPRQAIDAGIAYLTEDRKGLGLFLDMTIGENINLDVMSDDQRAGMLDMRAAVRRSEAAIARFSIRAPGHRTSVGALSGGNQQKVLFARLMERRPRVLILDEPTRGVDIGAKSEIYRLIDHVAAEGMGVIVISSELAEIIGTCDRTLVMREGRIVGDLPRHDFTQERIIALTTVGADAAAA